MIKIYHPLINYADKKHISSPYGKRKGGFHNGHDIAAPLSVTIDAAHMGNVVKVGYDRVYGNYVIIESKDKSYCTLYAHLEEVYVSEGDFVNALDKIGEVGTTGVSSGNHLHFELRDTGYNQGFWNKYAGTDKFANSVDPADYFPATWKQINVMEAFELGLITTYDHFPTDSIDYGTFLGIHLRTIRSLKIKLDIK